MFCLKPGMFVYTYNHNDTADALAVLLERDENPDLDELINPVDISQPIEKTDLERWKVRFLGDPPNSTYMRWIDRNKVQDNGI